MGAKPDLQPPVQDGCGEGREPAKAGVRLVQPQAEAAEVLQPVKRVLDEVPGAIQALVVPVLHDAVSLGRDAHADAAPAPVLACLVAVIAFVATTESGCSPAVSASAFVQSPCWPGEVSCRRMKPRPSTAWWALVVSPPRERPMHSSPSPRAPAAVRWHLISAFRLRKRLVLGSRDKVGSRNEICEVAHCEPLANQGIHSVAADYILPFHAKPQRPECNVVNALGSLRNFVPRP